MQELGMKRELQREYMRKGILNELSGRFAVIAPVQYLKRLSL